MEPYGGDSTNRRFRKWLFSKPYETLHSQITMCGPQNPFGRNVGAGCYRLTADAVCVPEFDHGVDCHVEAGQAHEQACNKSDADGQSYPRRLLHAEGTPQILQIKRAMQGHCLFPVSMTLMYSCVTLLHVFVSLLRADKLDILPHKAINLSKSDSCT
eukprot:1227308-Amphidinium_carterae.3